MLRKIKDKIVEKLSFHDDTKDLFAAIKRGDIDTVKAKLNAGVDPNTIYKNNTPLMAAIPDRADIAKLLLENGADPNLKIREQFPLLIAAKFNALELVELLLNKGAKVNDEYGATLRHAALYGKADLCKLLLKHNVDPNLENEVGLTPLLLAIKGNIRPPGKNILTEGQYEETFKILLGIDTDSTTKIKADPNYKNIIDFLPLHYAAELGLSKCCELLIQAGADVNARGRNNTTALIRAAKYNHAHVVDLLLQARADHRLTTTKQTEKKGKPTERTALKTGIKYAYTYDNFKAKDPHINPVWFREAYQVEIKRSKQIIKLLQREVEKDKCLALHKEKMAVLFQATHPKDMRTQNGPISQLPDDVTKQIGIYAFEDPKKFFDIARKTKISNLFFNRQPFKENMQDKEMPELRRNTARQLNEFGNWIESEIEQTDSPNKRPSAR